MTLSKTLFRRVLVLASAAVLLALLLGSVVTSKKRESQQRKVTSVPPVYSKVKSIEIVSIKTINEGTPTAGVEIEVKNKSNKPVMQIDLVAGDGAVTKNGLTDEDNPIVVIEPHGTTKLQMTFSEMSPDAPLVVSAVVFGDYTEEGDADSLKIMRKIRERDKEKIKAKKEGRQ
jgi:hypothetical protein